MSTNSLTGNRACGVERGEQLHGLVWCSPPAGAQFAIECRSISICSSFPIRFLLETFLGVGVRPPRTATNVQLNLLLSLSLSRSIDISTKTREKEEEKHRSACCEAACASAWQVKMSSPCNAAAALHGTRRASAVDRKSRPCYLSTSTNSYSLLCHSISSWIRTF